MKKIIVIIFLFCISCNNSKTKKTINVIYYNPTEFVEKSEDISLIFTTGFNNLEHLKIYANNTLLKEFVCKTDYSSGLSFLDGKHDSVASLLIPYKHLKNNNFLIIETKEEYFKILITNKTRNYNTLYISKDKSQWQASFENNYEDQIFE